MKYLLILIVLTKTLTSIAQENQSIVGRVTMSNGEVVIIKPDGQRTSAQRRSEVFEGDVLETGPDGTIHIRFVDSALVAISCNTKLNIQQYKFRNNEIVELNLIEGSMRTVSGQTSPANYTLHTESADAYITRASTDFRATGEPQAGVSISVFNGGVRVENNLGALDLGTTGGFNFAKVENGLPPFGLATTPAPVACD
ncbi:MAG: hypothetical protein DHS20C12_10600 [Pseudohongiella sp.]|nr:MAG: hypothetical protein DHS20C12_10600 [Pseudohongiella sp.]